MIGEEVVNNAGMRILCRLRSRYGEEWMEADEDRIYF